MASKGNITLDILGGHTPIQGKSLRIFSLTYTLLHQLWAFSTEQLKILPMFPLVQAY